MNGQIFLQGDRIILKSGFNAALVMEVKGLPGRKWNGDKKTWEIPSSYAAAAVELAEKFNLAVDSSIKNLLQEKISNLPIGTKERLKDQRLFPYQRQGIERLAISQKMLLLDQMGLGKTIQVLMALPDSAAAIVVCPASLKYNWQAECKKWRTDLNPVILKGKNSLRSPDQNELLIINYDILLDEEEADKIKTTNLIFDEIHFCKNRKAARSKRAKALSSAVFVQGGSIWGLTGTPILNNPGEFFGCLETACMAEIFGSWTRFMKLFDCFKDKWGGLHWGQPQDEAVKILKNSTLRRERQDVLPELPEKVYQEIKFDCSNKIQKQLEELGREWISKQIGTEAGQKLQDWEIQRFLKTLNKLPDFEMLASVRRILATSKIEIAEEIVAGHEESGDPVVVFSSHLDPVRALAEREGWRKITSEETTQERQEIVEQFQSGKMKGLACTIRAAGVGLTLTKAHHCLFIDLDWTPAGNAQAEDRLLRIGQKNNVLIQTIIANHSVDERIAELLQIKKGHIATVEKTSEKTSQTLSEKIENIKVVSGEEMAKQREQETKEQEQKQREQKKQRKRKLIIKEMISWDLSKNFHVFYTITKGEKRITIDVEEKDLASTFAPGQIVMSLKTGVENEFASSWTGFAFLNGSVTLWKRAQGTDHFEKAKQWFQEAVLDENKDYEIHLGRPCMKCNRLLLVPESIMAGIGPECARKE